MTTSHPDFPSACCIDPFAPFPLVEATVTVRNALAAPDGEFAELGGKCHEASHALALGLNRQGWRAKCVPASRLGDGHSVVRVGEWILDPTAEQFGVEGPVVWWIKGLPSHWYELEPFPDEAIDPSELALISWLAGYGDYDSSVELLEALDLTHLQAAIRKVEDDAYEYAETDAWLNPEARPASTQACFCREASVGAVPNDVFRVPGCVRHLNQARVNGIRVVP